MATSKTKHLDTAIDIFKGKASAKRATRKAQAELVVMVGKGTYTIQVNNRVVEEGEGDETYARERAAERAKTIINLGKSCVIVVY